MAVEILDSPKGCRICTFLHVSGFPWGNSDVNVESANAQIRSAGGNRG